jgi:hypothetical protein
MRPDVEDEVGVVAEGRGVTAIITILVVHHGRYASSTKSVSGAETSHSSSKNDNIWHLKVLSLIRWAGQDPGDIHKDTRRLWSPL